MTIYTVGYNYKAKDTNNDGKNDELYVISSLYSLNNGLLSTMRLISNNDDNKQINYNFNKYCSEADIEMYTRYKFEGNLKEQKYNLIHQEEENIIFPTSNTGATTYFTESVNVSLWSGNEVNLTFAKGGTNAPREQVVLGKITVR